MIFHETKLAGAYLIELDRRVDQRGFFARTFCAREFEERGLCYQMAGFAKQWCQTPHMVTSFADGTKISLEQAIVANATGMCIARRGMIGHEHKGHVDELVDRFNVDELMACGGIVEYVVAAAKKDLKAGETLDGLGGYMAYGLCENSDATHAGRLLPIGLAVGSKLKRDIAKDQVITHDDVEIPAGRFIDQHRATQDLDFFGSTPIAASA